MQFLQNISSHSTFIFLFNQEKKEKGVVSASKKRKNFLYGIQSTEVERSKSLFTFWQNVLLEDKNSIQTSSYLIVMGQHHPQKLLNQKEEMIEKCKSKLK